MLEHSYFSFSLNPRIFKNIYIFSKSWLFYSFNWMYKELGEDSQSQWARQPVPFSTSQFLIFLSVVGPLHQWLSTNFLLIVASSVHLQIFPVSWKHGVYSANFWDLPQHSLLSSICPINFNHFSCSKLQYSPSTQWGCCTLVELQLIALWERRSPESEMLTPWKAHLVVLLSSDL